MLYARKDLILSRELCGWLGFIGVKARGFTHPRSRLKKCVR
jgi:hypothetical protein